MILTNKNIVDFAQKLAKKPLELTMLIKGHNENIYFLGNGIEESMQLIVNAYGGYKAINNPLSFNETVLTGHLLELEGSAS